MAIGKVPGEIGILPEYRGVTGTPSGVNGPTWAMREKRRAGQGAPPRGEVLLGLPVQFRLHFLSRGEKGEGRERGRRKGGSRPLP